MGSGPVKDLGNYSALEYRAEIPIIKLDDKANYSTRRISFCLLYTIAEVLLVNEYNH